MKERRRRPKHAAMYGNPPVLTKREFRGQHDRFRRKSIAQAPKGRPISLQLGEKISFWGESLRGRPRHGKIVSVRQCRRLRFERHNNLRRPDATIVVRSNGQNVAILPKQIRRKGTHKK